MKTSSLFLGFSLIMIGALYVLRVSETQYQLQLEAPAGVKGNLASSSPGLIILTFGVVLVCLVLFSRSTVEYGSAQRPADSALGAYKDSSPITSKKEAVKDVK